MAPSPAAPRQSSGARAGTLDRPYRGPDRRGVARFVVPVRPPTLVLLALGALAVAFGDRIHFSRVPTSSVEMVAVAATLAIMGGIASILRWRLDGIARNWWCGWALLVIGVGQLVLEPIPHSATIGIELGMFIVGIVLFGRAVFGAEVDAGIGLGSTVLIVAAGLAVAVVPSLMVNQSLERARIAYGVIGGAWLVLAVAAALRLRMRPRDAEAGWIIPVMVALGLAELIPLFLDQRGAQVVTDRGFELVAMALASVGALGGLVQAAVHHRTRALRERIEHDRELMNRQRVEESFADRLHELRSTVVALEGGVATLPDAPEVPSDPESTLRAALIAEIRRLRTLVNESPAAAGVEAFDVASALAPTIELARSSGQAVTLDADGARTALGRPDEIAQVVHGLLANAAKYAPRSPVRVSVRHQLDEIAIRVEDQGPGIDPVHWDRIFERGFRVDPDAAPGSGLGLAVARRTILSQDGDLWTEETPGGGATFVISIPAAPALRIVPEPVEATGVMLDPAAPPAPLSAQEVR